MTDPTKLIAGLEGTNTWTLYVNICGNAAIQAGTTCPAPTPSCQVDGNSAFDCGGDGANNINYNGMVVSGYDDDDEDELSLSVSLFFFSFFFF